MTDSIAVGTAAWTGGAEYEEEYAMRIKKFIDTLSQQTLMSYVSALRDNRPCALSPEFSVGNFNLVRKIQFDDGVEWITRLRMPPLPGHSATAQKTTLTEMESELATMEFIR